MNKYQRTVERIVYDNGLVEVFDDEVMTPQGIPGRYFRFRFKGAHGGVVIVPRTKDGWFLLIRVHRYAFDDVSLEFPRGGILQGEGSHDAARRELIEETGLHPSTLSQLGIVRPDTSIAQVEAVVLLAEISATSQKEFRPEQNEAILGPVFVTYEQLLRSVREGTILDSYTLAAVTFLSASEIGKASSSK